MDEIDFRDAYAAPQAAPSKPAGLGPDGDAPDLHFLARWERLRLVYNGVLVAVVLITSGVALWRPFLEPGFWALLAGGAFGANVCFCTGPIAEAYLRWLGVKGATIGPILFGAGLLLSVPLTFILVVAYLVAPLEF